MREISLALGAQVGIELVCEQNEICPLMMTKELCAMMTQQTSL